MIPATEFSLMCPGRLETNIFAFQQTADLMSVPITAADGEEGLNNVPLLQILESTWRGVLFRTTHARKESGPEARSKANFRNPSVSFVISFIPQP
jgi:hypothetical protein